jgi:hypothetical protein
MRILIAKELRALLPTISFVVCVEIVGLIATFWTEFPDLKTLTTQLDPEKGVSDLAGGVIIISVLIATGLLVRERDDGTLGFLDGLPVSRSRLFAGKVLAGLIVLAGMIVFESAIAAWFHLMSRDSLEPAFPWQVLATYAAVHCVLAFTALGVCLALSFLGRWLFLVLALLAWAVVLAKESRLAHIDLFDPFTLTKPALHNGRWLISPANLGVQFALGAAGYAIALTGFRALGDGAHQLARKLAASRMLRLVGALGLIAIPVIWIALLAKLGHEAAAESEDWNPGSADPVVTATTAHYSFLYRKSRSAPAQALAARADAVHGQVAQFLHANSVAGPITVDTTSLLARHNAGQAYWKKVRMQLSDDLEANVAVLGHETTHVDLDLLSNFRASQNFTSTRFFHEGLATYVEYRFFRTPEQLREMRRPAVVANAWERVPFELLAKDTEFGRSRNPNLVYPLGELFCAAIVTCYGDEALSKIARALGRADAAKGLEAIELWQDTLQAAGYSLEKVIAEWHASLDRLAAEDHAFIASLPRVQATVEVGNGEIVIRPSFTGPPPGALVCVCRPSADAAEYEYDDPTREKDGTFRVSRAHYGRGTFWYQLGWRVPNAALPLLDVWKEAPAGN